LLLLEQHDRACEVARVETPTPSGFDRLNQQQTLRPKGGGAARSFVASCSLRRTLLLVEQHDRACEAARVETPAYPGFDRLNQQQTLPLVE